jgi:hypothetical protein
MTLVGGSRGALRALLAALLLAVSSSLLMVGTTTPAHALCATQPMQGDWRNIDPNTRSMTRVVVGFQCGDQILCDTEGNCSGGDSYFTLRPYGKCTPTDCDWGVMRAQSMGDGWQRAIYSYSWATKYVWVKTYAYYGRTYLRVYVRTDFTTADGRTDYTTDDWMLQ